MRLTMRRHMRPTMRPTMGRAPQRAVVVAGPTGARVRLEGRPGGGNRAAGQRPQEGAAVARRRRLTAF